MTSDRGTDVLVVEDNVDDEMLTLRGLGTAGVAGSVVVVRNGAEALDFLFAQGEHAERDASPLPRLVLLDLNLPRVNGLEVLRRLREDERTADLCVVIFSSSDEQCDRRESRRLGANDYVCKPLSSDAYCDAVRQVVREWLESDALGPRPAGPMQSN